MEVDFSSLTDKLQALIETVELGDEEAQVHVTQDMDDFPTAEMCPAVSIALASTTHQVRYIMAGVTGGGPDEIFISWEVVCFEFSAQGVKDANQRRNRLVNRVVDALRGDRTLSGAITGFLETNNIQFQTVQGGAGIYSTAKITVTISTIG